MGGVSVFLSKILNANLDDRENKSVGKLVDMLVEPGEGFLRITHVVIRRGGKHWSTSANVLAPYASGVRLEAERAQLDFQLVPEELLLLARDILDAQVIDIHGAKVIRVNDVQLDQVDGRWIVSGLDIGAWGLCRRLGIAHWLRGLSRTFGFTVPEGIIPWKEVAPLAAGFHSLQLQVSSDQIERMHPADLADIVEELGHRERQQLLATMTVEQTADLVEESDTSMQLAILKDLGDELAADVLEAMEPDDAADLLADVPADERDALLEKMEPGEAEELRRLMQWEDGTAGALMNTSYWSVGAELTRAEALAYFRSGIPLCEEVLHVYVLDPEQRFLGVAASAQALGGRDGSSPGKRLNGGRLGSGSSRKIQLDRVRKQMVRYELLAMPCP